MDVKNLSDEEFRQACRNIDAAFRCNQRGTALITARLSIDNLHRSGVSDAECNRLESYMVAVCDQTIRKEVRQ